MPKKFCTMGKMGKNAFWTLGQFKKNLNFKNKNFHPQMIRLTPRNIFRPLTIFSYFIKIFGKLRKTEKTSKFDYSQNGGVFWLMWVLMTM